MNRVVILILLLGSSLLMAQTAPNHTRLLYSHDLKSDNDNGIGTITNLGGNFTDNGWITTSKSQLRILFNDFLPHEGTVEFKMSGFDQTNIPGEFDWTAMSLWSRGEANFGDLNLSPASFFMVKLDEKLFSLDKTFKLFASAFGVDSDGDGKNDKLNSTYPAAQLPWNDPNKEYTFKIIWGRSEGYPSELVRIWLVVSDGIGRWSFDFDGQIESFAYLLLGSDDTYNNSIPGIIYKDLKVYGPATDVPFKSTAFSTGTRIDKILGGQGVAIANLDNNSDEDIYISHFYNTDRNSANQLLLEQGDDTFNEQAAARNLNDDNWSYGSFIADFDLDGDQDVFVANYNAANKLYFNDGAGNFSDVSSTRGISSDAFDTKGASIIDIENDGDTDIIVVNGTNQHKIYVNNGAGKFTVESRGIAGYQGTSKSKFQSAAVGDVNGDGYQDILLARQDAASLLFINNGSGSFSEESSARGFNVNEVMNSFNLGDIDNDGDLDVLAGISAGSTEDDPFIKVLSNDGNGNFTDISASAGMYANTFGSVVGDVDNDGDMDVFAPRRHSRLAKLYLNDGTGAFTRINGSGADIITGDGRGAATFDYNNDGFLDIYVTVRGGEEVYSTRTMPYSRNYLLKNENKGLSGNQHYLEVGIYNAMGALGGLGTKIWAYQTGSLNHSSGLIAYREITATSGFQSQNSYLQHLGLGNNVNIDLKIQLPDGAQRVFTGISVDQTIDIFPSDVVPTKLMVENCGQNGQAGSPLLENMRAQVVDESNAPAANIPVLFEIISGDGKLDGSSVQTITKLTDSQGYTEVAWAMGPVAGMENQLQISAQNNEQDLNGSPFSCSVVPTANNPAILVKKTGDNQSGVISETLTQPLAVQVTDLFDNPVFGHSVTFHVSAGNGSLNNQNQVTLQTNANGQAQTNWTLGPDLGQQTVSVSSDYEGTPLQNSPVEFIATATEPQNKITVQSGNYQQGVVGTILSNPFVVKVTNNSDQPLANYPVKFAANAGGGKFSGSDTVSVKTDAQGLATATATLGTAAGDTNNVFLAVAESATGSPVIFKATAVAGSATKMDKISGDGQSADVGTVLPNPLVVEITDQYGNPVKEFGVGYSVSNGGKINDKSTGTATTDLNGLVSANLILGQQVGVNAVFFQTDGLEGSPVTFTVTGTAGNPYKLVDISGNNQIGQPRVGLENPLVVSVQDEYGNPINNWDVLFSVTQGGGNLSGQTEQTVSTDENGQAHITFTLGDLDGEHLVRVTSFLNSQPLVNSPLVFRANTGPGDPSKMQIVSGNNQVGVVNTELGLPFAVSITDENGNGVFGHTVEFNAVTSNASFAGSTKFSTTTDSTGLAFAIGTLGSNYGDNIFTATSQFEGIALQGAPVQFKASGRKSLATYISKVSELTLVGTAGILEKNKIQVVVKGGNDLPISGHPVLFERKSGNCLLGANSTSTTVLSDENGIASLDVQLYIRPESTTIEASSDDGIENLAGSPILFQINSIVGPPAADLSLINVESPVLADGQTTAPIEITLQDAFGNPVSGKQVTLFSSGLDVTLIQPTDVTDENGESVGGIKSGDIGKAAVWSVVEDVKIPADTVEFVPGPPTKVTAFGDGQFAVKGTALPGPVGLIIQDEFSHFISNVDVLFSVTKGGGTVSQENVKTTEFGKAQVYWTLGLEREQQLAVKVDGIESQVIYNATALSPSRARLSIVSGDSAIGLVNEAFPQPLVVQLIDITGATIENETVNFDIMEGAGSFLSSSSIETDAQGKAQVYFKAGSSVGLHKVRAITPDIADVMIDFKLLVQAESTITLLKNSQDGSEFRPTENVELIVQALDLFMRPLQDVAINYQVVVGSGLLSTGEDWSTNATGLSLAEFSMGEWGPQQINAFAKNVKSDTVKFYFSVQNSAPQIISPAISSDTTILVEPMERLNFVVAALDADFDDITYSARNLPAGATFDSLGTHVFSWTPTTDQIGQFAVQFIAQDVFGAVDTLKAKYIVGGGNQPPQLVTRFPQEERMGRKYNELLLFVAKYTDPENVDLNYKWYINDTIYPVAATADSIQILFDSAYLSIVKVKAVVTDGVNIVEQIWTLDLVSSVELAGFEAISQSGAVTLIWKTKAETDNFGFDIYKSQKENGRYEQINSSVIRTNAEQNYSYADVDVNAGKTYFYKLVDIDLSGKRSEHGPISVNVALPERIALEQNYPNPFNPTTTISFELDKAQDVQLTIFNTSGQTVATLVSGQTAAGNHTVSWSAQNENGVQVPSGIYYYRLQAGETVLNRKLLLLK